MFGSQMLTAASVNFFHLNICGLQSGAARPALISLAFNDGGEDRKNTNPAPPERPVIHEARGGSRAPCCPPREAFPSEQSPP